MTNQEFIKQNQNKKISEIALLLSKQNNLDKGFILDQINGLQKAKDKLPEFANANEILFPTKLSLEQCSSEQTANYKNVVIRHSGLDPQSNIIDLTGGFGIDSYYFSKVFKHVTYIEPNKELFNIVQQNLTTLNTQNITLINNNCEDYLQSNTNQFDLAYIDPSRRNKNQKVFMLSDCTPNIIELQDDIFKVAPQILVKTSPILDIKQSIKELKTVSKIWVVSVNNECKEVLYLLQDKPSEEITINTVNLSKTKQAFTFSYSQEENTNVEFSEPLNYLYEANASILKAGAFKSVCNKFDVKKIATNTHIYTSQNLIKNFPGRAFKIENILPYQPKTFKKLGIKKANVSCRNFKDNVEQVKKKLNLKDGGNIYVFATTDNNNKPILIVNSKT